jgi:hypothetical protein
MQTIIFQDNERFLQQNKKYGTVFALYFTGKSLVFLLSKFPVFNELTGVLCAWLGENLILRRSYQR